MFSSLSSRLLFLTILSSSIIGCSGATSEDIKNGEIISGIINTSISNPIAQDDEVVTVPDQHEAETAPHEVVTVPDEVVTVPDEVVTIPDEVVTVPDEVVNTNKTGVATIMWVPPTENTDGTTLDDLAGYVIQYGKTRDSLTESVTINNPGVSTYTIENLDNNTVYYYAITSLNSSDIQSGYSTIVSKKTAS